ncbi:MULTISPECIES: hypothetical protein [unclassified Streptomyces]|uniref:hypothetical protein n=1 Tax=unclassified Streptomyces TaxID=2593676 RepID=UPI0036B004E4
MENAAGSAPASQEDIRGLRMRSLRSRPRPPRNLKRHRAVVTRYDKLAVRYEATVLVAVINEWL